MARRNDMLASMKAPLSDQQAWLVPFAALDLNNEQGIMGSDLALDAHNIAYFLNWDNGALYMKPPSGWCQVRPPRCVSDVVYIRDEEGHTRMVIAGDRPSNGDALFEPGALLMILPGPTNVTGRRR